MSSLLDLHLEYTSGSECTEQNHRWAMISCVAALLGRRVKLPFGHLTIYPNMYVFLVGLPATRKSTAISIAEKVLRLSDYDYFAFSRSSREKFLMDFEEGFNNRNELGDVDMVKVLDNPYKPDLAACSECYICIDEFIDFIKMNNSDFLTLLTTLYDNRDIPYRERLKNSKSVSIHKPTINILAGLTPTSLSMVMPPEMIGLGYTSRLIMVHSGKTSRRVTFPKQPDPKLEKVLVDKLRRISKFHGTMEYAKDAEVLLDKIYQNYIPLADSRLQHYCSRRFIHLLKLCMIFAAMRESLIITAEIVEEANTILSYTEANMHLALGEFGEAKHSKASQKVMEVLTQASAPLSMLEIWAAVSTDVERLSQLNDILNSLRHANKIIINANAAGELMVLLNRALSKQNTDGINYSKWIKEFEKLPEGF